MADKAPLVFETRLGMLKDLLHYDPASGALTWRERPVAMFKGGKQSAAHNCAIWNGKFANQPALAAPDKRGYLHGHLLSAKVKAHRVIWALIYGAWPDGEIDHIDGNPANNRLSNLRVVSHALNGRNLKLKKNNTSGHCGVNRRPSGRWCATVTVNGQTITFGTFDTQDEAIAARKLGEAAHGFHANHGTER